MILYSITYSKFTNNKNIRIKYEANGKINLYSYSNDNGFRRFWPIDKEELTQVLKRQKCKNNFLLKFAARIVKNQGLSKNKKQVIY